MKKIINGIEIDVRSESSCYVTINGVIFYLEHSDTAPMFMDCWNEIDSYKYEKTIKEESGIDCLNCGSLLGLDCGDAEPDYNEHYCSEGCYKTGIKENK